MDVEKLERRKLIQALEEEFKCFEEVTLRHVIFRNHTIRADVIAIPNDLRFKGHALAFEVKKPTPEWSMIDWCEAIKQASDYVYASIEPGQKLDQYLSHKVSASFLFPCPIYDRLGTKSHFQEVIRESQITTVSGALHLALHLRVGGAHLRQGSVKQLQLILGPNEVWNSQDGFRKNGLELMTRKRSLGSRKFDALSELSRIK